MEENDSNLPKAFKSKKRGEIIKVENCTYDNETKTASNFYYCSCSNDELHPICSACAAECHKKHHPSVSVIGIYNCTCGEQCHEIKEENRKTFHERNKKSVNKCFYNKFNEWTQSKGFYMYNNNQILCSVCAEFCIKDNEEKIEDVGEGIILIEEEDLDNDDKEVKIEKVEGSGYECTCSKHFEHNVLNLNWDFASKPHFNLHYQNFNFNILNKVPLLKRKYLDYLKDKMSLCIYNTEESQSNFFSEFINYKILECFSMFKQKWENKFIYLNDYFKGINSIHLIKMLSLTDRNIQSVNEAIRGIFFCSKIYFAELLFNYFIKKYIIRYNNLWNIHTIINMNIFQRRFYLHEKISFNKFNQREGKLAEEVIKDVYPLINAFIELYDKILLTVKTDAQNKNMKQTLFSIIFPEFTRVFKYIIKYNLLSREHYDKYFNLIYDSVMIWLPKKADVGSETEFFGKNLLAILSRPFEVKKEEKKKEKDAFKGDRDLIKEIKEEDENEEKKLKSAFYIMKSILYSLIYLNDKVCFNHILQDGKETFVFENSQLIETICKIFMMILNAFYRKDDLKRTIIYDYYVKKILELLIEKENFYTHSLDNLNYISEHHRVLLSSNDIYEIMINIVNHSYINKIYDFTTQLGVVNREYFEYNCNSEEYINKTKEIMNNFKSFIKDQVYELPKIDILYLFFDKNEENKSPMDNITKFQQAIVCSTFFKQVEEYIHINIEILNFNKNLHCESFSFLLQLFTLIIQNNPENLSLIMNINPKIFVSAFFETGDSLYDFLERMTEMFFDTNYEYDNYYFYTECLCIIIKTLQTYFQSKTRTHKRDLTNIKFTGRTMGLVSRMMHLISIKHYELINVINAISKMINNIKSEKNAKDIITLIERYFDNPKVKDDRYYFLVKYYNYIADLIENDIIFFSITTIEDMLLFDIPNITVKINYFLDNNILPIELEYAIVKFYFAMNISFNFDVHNLDNQIRRTFFPLVDYFPNEDENETIISNVCLPNLSISSNSKTIPEIKNELNNNVDKLKISLHLINKLISLFVMRFNSIFSHPAQFTNLLTAKIMCYKYLEELIIRPIYKLSNYLLLYDSYLKNVTFEQIGSMIRNLFTIIVSFYSNIHSSNLYNGIFEKEVIIYTNKIKKIFFYENISLHFDITKDVRDSIDKDKSILYSGKFIELKDIYPFIVQNIKKIFYINPKITMDKSDNKSKNKIIKINELIDRYKKVSQMTNDNDLCFIKSVEEMEKEFPMGNEIISYLLYKLSDPLTEENTIEEYNNYTKGKIKSITFNNFKFQNSYILQYFTLLFYNYCDVFQREFSIALGKHFDSIFKFLHTNIIFSSNLTQVLKLYELDRIGHFNPLSYERYPSIGKQLCCFAIGVLKNLCEDHNTIFQNRFFNYNFKNLMNVKEKEKSLLNIIGKSSNKQLLFEMFSNWKKKVPTINIKEKRNLISQKFDIRKFSFNVSEEENKYLNEIKFSFLNFIMNNMRIIIENLNLSKDETQILLSKTHELKSTDYIFDIFQKYADLIAEMLQKTEDQNLQQLYYNLREQNELFDKKGNANPKIVPYFSFLRHCIEINSIQTGSKTIFNPLSLSILQNTFNIIIIIITQKIPDNSFINCLIMIFPPSQVLFLISQYLRGVMVKNVMNIDYEDEEFIPQFNKLKLSMKHLKRLKEHFIQQIKLSEDPYFKLAAQMYLFLTVLGKKYKVQEVERLLEYSQRKTFESLEEDEERAIIITNNSNTQKFDDSKLSVEEKVNNLIITSKFFYKFTKTCNFLIEEKGKMELRTFYFIVNPKVYFIPKSSMNKFLDEVDRSSSTSKLKALINILDDFINEIDFKFSAFQKRNYLKNLFQISYEKVDIFNFSMAIIINIINFIILDRSIKSSTISNSITTALVFFQIIVNLIYISIFLISKYPFYVILSKSKYSTLSFYDALSVYIFDSLLFHEETYFLFIIVTLGIIGLFSQNRAFIFSLELLSVIKPVATTREIVVAIISKISDFLALMGFIIIVVFVYANLGFHIFPSEFIVENDNGDKESICSSLFECFLLFFNQGLRSGGGIGDILSTEEFNTGIYWIRWVNDFSFYVFISIMALNMVLGVIVSKFSKIREESGEKEEDINNKCFICNIDRNAFETRKINFKEHQKYDHNVKNYIRFLIHLKCSPQKDLDTDQGYVINAVKNGEIKCFPVGVYS